MAERDCAQRTNRRNTRAAEAMKVELLLDANALGAKRFGKPVCFGIVFEILNEVTTQPLLFLSVSICVHPWL
jgi:hypothetical protein